jgi:hypothetical protein
VGERLAVKEEVGTHTFFSKSVAAAASTVAGCKAAILEYRTAPGNDKSEGTLYVYNLDTRRLEGKMEIDWYGDVQILHNGRALLADMKRLVPNKLPDGRTVGSRVSRIGIMRVYDLSEPERFSTIRVPEEGTGFWVSPSGDHCVYVSPRELAIIDLKTRSVLKTIENPLSSVQSVVFLNN